MLKNLQICVKLVDKYLPDLFLCYNTHFFVVYVVLIVFTQCVNLLEILKLGEIFLMDFGIF